MEQPRRYAQALALPSLQTFGSNFAQPGKIP
jgi:hypothetical protein